MQELCIMTMLRNDYQFLEKWIAHYRGMVEDPSALVVLAHGNDPEVRRIARDCSIIAVPFFRNGSRFELRRRGLFFSFVAGMLNYYHHVITTDVDEFIVLNPELGQGMGAYLQGRAFDGVALSPVGFDIVHRPSVEPGAFDWGRPLTEQRRFGFLEAAYCKPCIFRSAPLGGGNAHLLDGEPWQIDPDLFLFHARYFDRGFGVEMAQKRRATVERFEMLAKTHRIGGWHNREAKLEDTIAQVEAGPWPVLGAADIAGFAQELAQGFAETGKFPWASSQRGPFEVPLRFIGAV
ncbi:glycosyltransferase family 2 protein [Alphaproteobacteria bacterium KMM 3653]|uniref:Glycosyltransferase family 2 protein n=1 Tax=Harenicola maris TaxID=2841044 RepID=A0AAP2GAA1_9RHOB|nr:glycosyltransferase family 2 protein [Harenicola maris]